MTKQEKIQEDWIEVVGVKSFNKIKHFIYENGTIEGFVLKQKLGHINSDLIEIFKSLASVYIPKSLQGIENNNGWIKIESEDDLPKSTGKYKAVKKDGKIIEQKYRKFDDNDAWMRHITHYKKIITEELPIY